jgi:hypothetical protein
MKQRLARPGPVPASKAFFSAAVLTGSILTFSCSSHVDDLHNYLIHERLTARDSIVALLKSPALPDSATDSRRDSLVSILWNRSVAQRPGEADIRVLGTLIRSARCGGPKEALAAVFYLQECASSDSIGYASRNIAAAALEAALNNPAANSVMRGIITDYLKNPKKTGSEPAPPCCERQ